MDINEAIMWAAHAQTSMQVNGDPYGAKLLGKAVKSLRAHLAEVEAQRDGLREDLRKIASTRIDTHEDAHNVLNFAREAYSNWKKQDA